MDTIGGFRLVRRLGSGDRADVHLAQSVNETDGAPPRVVAVKVFRATTSFESIDHEIDALARVSSPFLLPLHDLAVGDDGRPVLILGRLGPMTCSRLILDRPHLGAGEAVTILAPLVDAFSELASVGVVHGRVRLDRVGFDEIGTPVLMGFGHARTLGPMPDSGRAGGDPSWVADHPALVRDTGDLAAFSHSVLDAVRGSGARSDLLAWLASPLDDLEAFRAELRDRLYDLAAPEPVALKPAARRPIGAGPRGRPDVSAITAPVGPAEAAPDWLKALHLPAWVLDAISTRGEPTVRSLFGDLLRRARGFLAPVRRPIWIAAGSVALLLVATLVVSGLGSASDARADSAPLDATAPAGTTRPASAIDPGENPSTVDSPAAGEDKVESEPGFDDAAITAEDPVAAATALLRARDACIRRLSVLCLDGVDQVGGAAIEADSALIRRMQEGAADAEPVDPTAAVPAMSQHLGGTVILSLAFPAADDGPDPLPASLLLVRGEEGWRIRDLIVG